MIQDGGKLGELRFDSTAPLVSRAWTTIEQTYTVGDLPIAGGGGFMLGVAGTGQEGRAQHDDPKAPGYVTVRASRPGVTFDARQARVERRARRGALDRRLPVFRLGAALEPGDTVTFTYGDRSQGSTGIQVPTYSNDGWLLPIYVDLDATADFFGLRWPTVAIVGKPEVAAVRLLGPSVVARGEAFSVTVRSEDDAMNRASGPMPAYEVMLDGKVVGRVAAGRNALARVDDLRIDQLGVHRLEVQERRRPARRARQPGARRSGAEEPRPLGRDARPHRVRRRPGLAARVLRVRDRTTRGSTSRRSPSTTSGSTTPSGARCSG